MLHLSHPKLKLTGLLLVSAIAFLTLSSNAHAASITVATGNDETTVNSNCSLSEAITNINNGDATSYPECTGAGAYGTDDTINLPAGAITLTSNLPEIETSVVIQGEGMGESTVDGDFYNVFRYNQPTNDDTLVLKGLRITAYDSWAIDIRNASVELEEVDIDGAGSSSEGGFLMNELPGTNTISLTNIKVHDLAGSSIDTFPIGGTGEGITNVNVQNVSIYNLAAAGLINGMLFSAGFYGNDATFHTVNAQISNLTITNAVSTSGTATLLTAFAHADGGTSSVNIDARNVTLTGMRGATSVYGESEAISATGAALSADDEAVSNINLSNLLIADNIHTGLNASHNCATTNMNSVFGGTGIVNSSITSSGGNISDDTTCAPFLNQSTDQNNVTNLNSTLGTLSDNGGFVQTIPLLENSPAVDGGVTVSGLTADARLAVRPQGNAFDSGAYESPFTRAANSSSTQSSLASTGQNTLLITVASLISLTLGGAAFSQHRRSL